MIDDIFDELIVKANEYKKCTKCGEIKHISEFTPSNKYHCKECLHKRTKEYVQYRKNNLYEFKTPCVKCGENRLYLIQFHHIDPKTKLFTIGSGVTKGYEALENEVSKCVCLCSNCHIEFHYLYGKNPENPIEALEEYLNNKY